MKLKIKKTLNNGTTSIFDVYSEDLEVLGKNTSSSLSSERGLVSRTWYYEDDHKRVDPELDTFIGTDLKGGLYEHSDYKFEILSRDES